MSLPDTDGVLLLAKYAFNLEAGRPVHTLMPGSNSGLPAIWLDPQRHRLVVEFVRRRSSTGAGVAYEVQFTDRLPGWSTGGTRVSTVAIDQIWERVRYEDEIAATAARARFGRVAVVRQ